MAKARGSDLLNPEQAQHAHMLRYPGFLSLDEISIVRREAARHRDSHPGCGGTLYLQHEGLHDSLVPIVARIYERVWLTDAEHWGLNAVHELEGVSGLGAPAAPGLDGDESDASVESASFCTDGTMYARTIEFHEYGSQGRKCCGTHSDYGSM